MESPRIVGMEFVDSRQDIEYSRRPLKNAMCVKQLPNVSIVNKEAHFEISELLIELRIHVKSVKYWKKISFNQEWIHV